MSGDGANFLWFLPTSGDGRYLGSRRWRPGGQPRLLDADRAGGRCLGYFGVLLPTGRPARIPGWWPPRWRRSPSGGASSWPCVPACCRPTLAARMTATLDRLSGGRLLINVVTGGDPVESRGDGISSSMTSATP